MLNGGGPVVLRKALSDPGKATGGYTTGHWPRRAPPHYGRHGRHQKQGGPDGMPHPRAPALVVAPVARTEPGEREGGPHGTGLIR
ncbi:hypothetical protein GCM10022408_28630 [Hymenobacter fastidiosus]|uniref:Uncharacterized protein n=1 Tax=Hymenobacter fastidiosus TaxID=486264 RepID=A0ABP7SMV3_9BACT